MMRERGTRVRGGREKRDFIGIREKEVHAKHTNTRFTMDMYWIPLEGLGVGSFPEAPWTTPEEVYIYVVKGASMGENV